MRIRYRVRVEDIIALHQHQAIQMLKTPAMRWLWPLTCGVVLPAFLVGVAVVILAFPLPVPPEDMTIFFAVVAVLFSSSFLLLTLNYHRIMRHSIRGQVIRMCHEGKCRGMLEAQELELTVDALIHRNAIVESRTKLECLQRVELGSGYTFVFSNLMSPHVIPHAAVTEGDPVAFTEALREKVSRSQSD